MGGGLPIFRVSGKRELLWLGRRSDHLELQQCVFPQVHRKEVAETGYEVDWCDRSEQV